MLKVIVPSRGRPESALRLIYAVADTRRLASTSLVFAIDQDDPDLNLYKEIISTTRPGTASLETVRGGWMVAALNEAALTVVSDPQVTVVGFFGDDHRPRTEGWDRTYTEALEDLGAGIVYGDDLLQHEFVPTQCAMSASIIRELGWMCHPSLKHMYVDTLWRDMGNVAKKLAYLPNVVIEHMHYLNGKAVMDEGYERVNDPGVYALDEKAFRLLHANGTISRAGDLIAFLARQAGK